MSILQSIENGARTLFDIVSKIYADVDRKLWIPASFNVRLHVDHLNSQNKLPKVRVFLNHFESILHLNLIEPKGHIICLSDMFSLVL